MCALHNGDHVCLSCSFYMTWTDVAEPESQAEDPGREGGGTPILRHGREVPR